MGYLMVESEYLRLVAVVAAVRERHAGLLAEMGPTHEAGGGWHDNAAFDHLKADERRVLTYLRQLEDFLRDCMIVQRKDSYAEVEIGCIVLAAEIDAAGEAVRKQWILIAGDTRPPRNAILDDGDEGDGTGPDDPFAVSTDSPIGKALMGAKIGDERQARVNERVRITYRVLELG